MFVKDEFEIRAHTEKFLAHEECLLNMDLSAPATIGLESFHHIQDDRCLMGSAHDATSFTGLMIFSRFAFRKLVAFARIARSHRIRSKRPRVSSEEFRTG